MSFQTAQPVDRAAFFDHLRRSGAPFGEKLAVGQVQGCETLIDEAVRRRVPRNSLAYMLATTDWETAHTMQPIAERGAFDYFNKYEPGTKLGKVLGNTTKGDGYRYRGRGYVMITGRANYARAGKKLGIDLIGNPDLALRSGVAVQIMFSGMAEGWFTGKNLDDYIDEIDEADSEDLREFVNARRIVNGTDKAEQIGRAALVFEAALGRAKYPAQTTRPLSEPDPITGNLDEAQTPPKAVGVLAVIVVVVGAVAFALVKFFGG